MSVLPNNLNFIAQTSRNLFCSFQAWEFIWGMLGFNIKCDAPNLSRGNQRCFSFRNCKRFKLF